MGWMGWIGVNNGENEARKKAVKAKHTAVAAEKGWRWIYDEKERKKGRIKNGPREQTQYYSLARVERVCSSARQLEKLNIEQHIEQHTASNTTLPRLVLFSFSP